MAHQRCLNRVAILGLFEAGFETAGGAVDEECFDLSGQGLVLLDRTAELKRRASSSEPPLRHNHLRVAPAELKLRAS